MTLREENTHTHTCLPRLATTLVRSSRRSRQNSLVKSVKSVTSLGRARLRSKVSNDELDIVIWSRMSKTRARTTRWTDGQVGAEPEQSEGEGGDEGEGEGEDEGLMFVKWDDERESEDEGL